MQTTHMATPVLEVAHLEKVYGALGNVTRALNDVSFTVNRGEFVGIMGASGSGKSTLLNCVSTIDSATSGTIRINGQDVTRMKQAKLSQFRREELGFIFQDSNLLDTLTARENIALALTINHVAPREVNARVEAVAARLQIAEVLDKMPHEMSGGQRQRLTIARALVGSPQILIMDDSASALDFKTDAALRHAIRERSVRGAAEGGLPLTTVIVSQRVSTVRDADMICVLDHGSVAGLGTHDELYANCQLYREICQSQLRREELEGQQGSAMPASAPSSASAPAAPASTCAKEGC